MSNDQSTEWQLSNPEKLARQFSRLGWLGFWIQLTLLAVPILLLVYVVFLRGPDTAPRMGVDLSNYLSYGSLVVMVFTTFWFFRYTRVGKRIADPDMRPRQSAVLRTLWIGLWASCVGIVFSMLLMLAAAGRLLFILMANPQTGIMIAPAPGGDPIMSVSAIDAVSLTALVVILAAELIVMGLTLWLLFRATRPASQTAEETA